MSENRNSNGSASHRFQALVMPHVDAAYNLARWLLHDATDAEDVVQEACLRAYSAMGSFSGDDARAWLLKIVRNACFTWMRRKGRWTEGGERELDQSPAVTESPMDALQRQDDIVMVRSAIERLPAEFRELIVLREMEGLSYKDMADLTGVPIGTVMSRLSRARERLARDLATAQGEKP